LLAIAAYHEAQGNTHRDVCLIPASAHGTNAASAVLAGLRVVVVKTAGDEARSIWTICGPKLAEHAESLAA